jgi:hypothetical protein
LAGPVARAWSAVPPCAHDAESGGAPVASAAAINSGLARKKTQVAVTGGTEEAGWVRRTSTVQSSAALMPTASVALASVAASTAVPRSNHAAMQTATTLALIRALAHLVAPLTAAHGVQFGETFFITALWRMGALAGCFRLWIDVEARPPQRERRYMFSSSRDNEPVVIASCGPQPVPVSFRGDYLSFGQIKRLSVTAAERK